MKKEIIKILPVFLPIALAITLILGIVYVVMQQNYRISANDPQIQIAEDIATQLSNGAPPQAFVPNGKIDISKSLGSFILIYDKNGKSLGGSAVIGSKEPVIPQGVFTTTKSKGETRFTWQPQNGTRIALVVTYYKNKGEGYVAIGKSLKEVENRIDNLGAIIFLGWGASLIITFAFVLVSQKYLKLK